MSVSGKTTELILPCTTHDHVRPIRRSEHDDAIELLNTIHLRQQTHQNPVAGRAATVVGSPSRCKRVNLVLQATFESATWRNRV